MFDGYLDNYPQWEFSKERTVNLLIDATRTSPIRFALLFTATRASKKRCCTDRVMVDFLTFSADKVGKSNGEYYDEILEDLRAILSLAIRIENVTCDGKQAILKAVRKADKSIIIQRCTVHIQLMCKLWFPQNPQSETGRKLRSITQRINSITDYESWRYWVMSLVRWEEEFRDYLNAKSYKDDPYWYTHKMVRRSFVTIRRALPDMFHYLSNPSIPKSTNSLESFSGNLKQKISLHRGRSKSHFAKFIVWYLYLNNNTQK